MIYNGQNSRRARWKREVDKQMKRVKKGLASLLVCLMLAGCQNAVVPDEPVQTPPQPEPPKTVRFLAAGDDLIHGSIYLQAERRAAAAGESGYDFGYLYENVAPFLQDRDLCYINQETLINDVYAPSTYPCFSSPAELGGELYDMGFRIFSVSNNHTYDKGAGGIAATRAYWAQMPADTAVFGLYTDPKSDDAICLYEKNGITFAFLAYTEHTNGIPTPSNSEAAVVYTSDEETMEWQIRRARELADVVVVAPHWGVEGSHHVTDAQRTLAAKMCGWGADVILGSHPHVLQDETTQRNALVIYSLGNFVSAQSAPDNLISGFFTFDVTLHPDGRVEITSPLLHPLVTHYSSGYRDITAYLYSDYTPELAAAHGVRANYPRFSYDYIGQVLKQTIQQEYLALP